MNDKPRNNGDKDLKDVNEIKDAEINDVEKNRNEEKHYSLEWIGKKVDELGVQLERVQIADYVALLNRPRRLFILNLVSGIARGIGIALGFTVFAATIIYILQRLGALNLPIIGDYIADIVKIVQAQLNMDRSFR
ncbi:DUF5665 domain-containing protein [Tepidibacillus fermentans]|uniref:Uncharacterized protein n=1 Tax=Tepidibacillus fermentans TaxID=1281767 RepID=A0A4R3KKI5_9BACI|nr:DUF5665 domain-containing protein [Tepidibacillus fermentans]TCS84393.1 hypothetical protein EDD72_10157 [Tepidibacillus fermentans]